MAPTGRSKRRRRPPTSPKEELEDSGSSAPEVETTTSGSQSKKRWGEQGRNQYPEGKWRVDVVSPAGEPIEPPMVHSKFWNAIGAILRTKEILDPSISDWLLVPEGRKEAMWKLLKQIFILPRSEELRKCVKHYTRKQLDESFRQWRSELNDKYVKKGLTPFNEYGSITPAQWDEFVRQKISPKALALIQRNRELALSNIHKVHFEPGGEAAIAARQPDPFEDLDERGWQWLAARKPTIVDGKPTFSTSETYQRKGEFVPNRDKYVLSSALGMKEHGGYVGGVSSKLTIKDGFERDRASYKSHSCYKDDLREVAEKALESRFKDFLLDTLAEQQQNIYAPSSIGSTIAQPYPIDSICINTPCSLHIPVGRVGKTKEVPKGLAILVGGLFKRKPIPHHYACVTVLEINSNYGDPEIDIPTMEGIHCFG
uniref:Transposase Tnp1/En/Spm-like domain-containing protein n=1 Tax=Setaria viridis TaxID=4556 RepID=A0A4U6SXL9_SETVI|nr:hypothetical protein SEVIR_9G255400v2 [Setaria viridis]